MNPLLDNSKTNYSTLFEGIDLSHYTPEQIMGSKKLYDYIVESAEIAREENRPLDDVVDEGIFGALVGAAAVVLAFASCGSTSARYPGEWYSWKLVDFACCIGCCVW